MMTTEQDIEAIARKFWPAPNWTIVVEPHWASDATHDPPVTDPLPNGYILRAMLKGGGEKRVTGKTLDELKLNVEKLIAKESKPYG